MNYKELKNVEIPYRGHMFEIITWEGRPGKRFEAAVRSPGVRLIIETIINGEPALLLTREKRRETNGWDIRLPGGKVFNTLNELDAFRESGEDIKIYAIKTAKSEGREEAGIQGGEFELYDISKAGSSVEWDLFYYIVGGAVMGDQELEESEIGDIETITMTFEEIFDALKLNQIGEGRSAAVLWRYLASKKFIT